MRTTAALKALKNVIPLISFARRQDVDKYLKRYHITLEGFKCTSYGTPITRENIGAIIKNRNQIKILCNKPECIAKLTLTPTT